jgi:hypothetical protein
MVGCALGAGGVLVFAIVHFKRSRVNIWGRVARGGGGRSRGGGCGMTSEGHGKGAQEMSSEVVIKYPETVIRIVGKSAQDPDLETEVQMMACYQGG